MGCGGCENGRTDNTPSPVSIWDYDLDGEPLNVNIEDLANQPHFNAVQINQLLVVEQIYHLQSGSPIVWIDTRYKRDLNTDEQTYDRRTKATDEWRRLDYGWAETPAMIIVRNEEAESEKMIELGIDTPSASRPSRYTAQPYEVHRVLTIPPGESARLTNPEPMMIRASGSKCKYTLYALPFEPDNNRSDNTASA